MGDGPRSWWRRLTGGADAGLPTRWVVLDVESSGLDPQHDRLLAIAALGVQTAGARPRLVVADSFEVVLQQPADNGPPDRDNILVHGIGVQAQREGRPPAQALQAFVDFVGRSPLVAFHAGFDRVLIRRALHDVLRLGIGNPWLDLADLAPVLCPRVAGAALEDWLAHFDISVAVRHQAMSDTWATAELLQRLWPLAQRQGLGGDFRALARAAAARRWVS